METNIRNEIDEINPIICENPTKNYDFGIDTCKRSSCGHLKTLVFRVIVLDYTCK